MIIQHNIISINAHRQLGVNNTALSKKLEKLSSGYRINIAADDAAGLAVSEKMRAQITGLGRAVLNAHDGVSLVQTAEGALQEIHAQLNRLEQLAVQAANGIYGTDDRQKLQAETDALLKEFDRISRATNFNGIKLLDGSLSKNKSIANAAIAQAPPPYATPMALSAMSTFGVPVAGLEGAGETMGIQPLGGGIGTQSVETINFNSLKDVDATGDGWSYSAANKLLTITGNNTFEINGTRTQTDTRIVVKDSVTWANITLNNVNIKTDAGAALDMRRASANLNIMGTNTLTSTALDSAGVQTASGHLTINGTGSLTATGGGNGAGIGGGKNESSGTITIEGGTVTANGGNDGAGIGGGVNGAGGNITIKGGTVNANSSDAGAGVGGGKNGNGGSVMIGGGTINAKSTNSGAGIGGGAGGKGADVLMYGGRVTATGGSTAAGDVGGGMGGAAGTTEIAGGTLNAAKVQGDIKSPNGDKTYKVVVSGVTFPPNTNITYTIGGLTDFFKTDTQGRLELYLPASDQGKTLEIMMGTTKCTGTVTVNTSGVGSVTLDYARNVGGTTIDINNVQEGQYGDDWKFESGVLTISGNKNYTINGTGVETTNRIKVDSGTDCAITLNNVNISTADGAALDMRDATVRLNLEGASTLTSTVDDFAGIQTTNGSLTIDGQGSLEAQGGGSGAGIGGGAGGAGGTVTINGGTVIANGGGYGAGIGGGYSAGGGTVTINGGTVIANGGGHGAGIGGGFLGSGGTITINGGTVTATAKSFTFMGQIFGGAGIGGGGGSNHAAGSGGTITITGGIVVAKGAGNCAGIGGGGSEYANQGGSGGNITISGGIVTAYGDNYGAAIGGGKGGNGGTVTISGGLVEVPNTGASGRIGNGYGGTHGGSCTITGGNLSIADPNNILAGATNGSASVYQVEVQGVAFDAHEEVSYTFNGTTYNVTTDSNGKLFLYLPESANRGTFTMNYKSTDYTLTAVVKTDHSGYIRFDETAPTITAGATNRIDEANGTVNFIPSEAGEYYYAVVEKGTTPPPNINTNVPGIVCDTSEQTITFNTLTGEGAKDVYVVMKDEVGNLSSVEKIELPGGDWTAPAISSASSERIDETTGKVEFDSSEAGTYYYLVKDADDVPPLDVDAIKAGTSGACAKGGNTLNLNGLTGNSAKTVYLVVEDKNGNVSGIQPIGLDAFVPKYNVEITLPGGVTFPADTDITVTVGGKPQTVKTDGGGKLLVPMPDGDNDIKLSHGGKNYGGVATVSGNPTSVELAEIVTPPPPPPAKGLVLQVGDTADDYNKLTVYIEGTSAAHLGLSALSLQTQEAASAALSKIRDAIERVSVNRGQLGAYQNRLEHTINNLNNTVENMTAAESRIRDADMANEMMEFTVSGK